MFSVCPVKVLVGAHHIIEADACRAHDTIQPRGTDVTQMFFGRENHLIPPVNGFDWCAVQLCTAVHISRRAGTKKTVLLFYFGSGNMPARSV